MLSTKRSLALLAGLSTFAATAPAFAADPALDELFNDAINGGVVVDGFAAESLVSTKMGNVVVRIPNGATVRRAWLITSLGDGTSSISPSGLATPRQVVLGSGANTKTVVLEGPFQKRVTQVGYGATVTEVTTEVKAIVGTGTGSDKLVPIAESNDGVTDFQQSIYGHALVVVYDHAASPLRNVFVGGGVFTSDTDYGRTNVLQTVTLKRPVATCKAPFDAEPWPMAVSIADETPANALATSFQVNGKDISTELGGFDDNTGDNVTLPYQGLYSVGSFGAKADGTPEGLTKMLNGKTYVDSITAKPASSESRGAPSPTLGITVGDDELYDLRTFVTAGTSTVAFRYYYPKVTADPITTDNSGLGGMMSLVAFQTGAGGTNGCDTVIPPACTMDSDCVAGRFCNDGKSPVVCDAKLTNGTSLPAGGTINGTCTPAAATRVCVSAKCETSDNKCGLLDGSACTVDGECRSSKCTAAKCGTGSTSSSSSGSSGSSGTSSSSSGGVSSTSSSGNVDGDSVEGGGGCTTGSANGSSLFPVAGLAFAAASVLRRRRKQ